MSGSTASILQPFVCGGASAMLASSCVHPIDLAKVRLQLYATTHVNKPSPGFVGIIVELVKKDGIAALYAGLSAALMRQAVYGTARIGLHRSISDELVRRNNGQNLSFLSKVLSGMASGSIAVCLGTPFDVALVRMQADSMKQLNERRGYKNVFDALIRVTKEEGFGKLYSGLSASVLRGMSINVGMMACYDQAKEFIGYNFTKDKNPSTHPSLQTQMGASIIAGFTASFFSLPFDLLKSRMQDSTKGKGVLSIASNVVKNEGPLAFWTGFGAYYLRTATHAMIILMS
jgi:solute carrier family 25 oxoglutarate transporter 11